MKIDFIDKLSSAFLRLRLVQMAAESPEAEEQAAALCDGISQVQATLDELKEMLEELPCDAG